MPATKEPNESLHQVIRAATRRLATGYRACALLVFNSLVFYLLLNLVLWAAILIRDAHRASDPITDKYDPDLLDKVYPDYDRAERARMLSEIWNRSFIYDDFTHFQERPIGGKYVHVTEAGYRCSVHQGPWPPTAENLNVFVFGGSTTFGYGVPDAQTIPSFLQEALASHTSRRVCVYNFGVGWYYSTQERIRFEKLLFEGHVPDIAVFIDGLNERRPSNKPAYSEEMARAFEQVRGFERSHSPDRGNETKIYWQRALEVCFLRLPIGLVASHLRDRLAQSESGKPPNAADVDTQTVRWCNTFLANKFLIEQSCRHFGVTPIFVWQPVPGYKYDLKYNLFTEPIHRYLQQEFYSTMRALLDQRPAEPHFVWCADLQQDRTEPLYLDHYHYTGAFAKDIADYICLTCLERKILDKHLCPISPSPRP
jgi:hypothetical protein